LAAGGGIMSDSELQSIIERLNQARILVLGELWLEQRLRGQAVRGDAEGLSLKVSERRVTVGGAAAVASAAAALGARSWVAGALGRDAQGGEILRALGAAGVDPFAVVNDSSHATGEKLELRIEGQAAGAPLWIRVDLSPAVPLGGHAGQEMLGHVEAVIGQTGAAVLLAAPGVPDETGNAFARIARDHGKPMLAGIKCASVDDCSQYSLPSCDIVVAWTADDEDMERDADRARALVDSGSHRALVVFSPAGGARLHRAAASDAETLIEAQAAAGLDWEACLAAMACAVALGADAPLAVRAGAAAAGSQRSRASDG
jgi:bifunctional ADP-heptose synthase (sugar kinase/adenylyltransferase)